MGLLLSFFTQCAFIATKVGIPGINYYFLGNLGLDTGELLPLHSQDTEFKGFKSLCTSGFILCPVPAELPYVTVTVPGLLVFP